MTQNINPSETRTLFASIREGMDVIDSKGDKVGSVRDLYFGADSDEMDKHGVGAASAPDPSVRDDDIVTNVAEALFADDDLPEVMRNRLINNGYIRIDTSGLFASDRFVLPEQIARVHDDHVHLNVEKDELLKR